MKIYWTSVEFDILDPSQYDNCIGGFVYLFFQANDVLHAIPIIEKEIKSEGLTINEIEFIARYDEVTWGTEEEQNRYDSLAKEVESTDQVVWDEIFAYESKDE